MSTKLNFASKINRNKWQLQKCSIIQIHVPLPIAIISNDAIWNPIYQRHCICFVYFPNFRMKTVICNSDKLFRFQCLCIQSKCFVEQWMEKEEEKINKICTKSRMHSVKNCQNKKFIVVTV